MNATSYYKYWGRVVIGFTAFCWLVCAASSQQRIVLVGLPRSGQDAFQNFFECYGYPVAPSYKQPCGIEEDNIQTSSCAECLRDALLENKHETIWRRCGNYSVYAHLAAPTSDNYFLPQHYSLSSLHENDPDALWILNVRSSPESWTANVLHWYSDTVRLLGAFGILYSTAHATTKVGLDQNYTTEQLIPYLKASIDRANNATEHEHRRTALQEIYSNHTRRVLDFCRYTGHPVVTLDIDDKSNALRFLVQRLELDDTRAEPCWSYDAATLDNDWKDLSLKV